MFASLTIFGNTGFKFASTTSDDENSTISLGSISDYVFNEVTMSRGVENLQIKFQR
jgi:hypothetical protein